MMVDMIIEPIHGLWIPVKLCVNVILEFEIYKKIQGKCIGIGVAI